MKGLQGVNANHILPGLLLIALCVSVKSFCEYSIDNNFVFVAASLLLVPFLRKDLKGQYDFYWLTLFFSLEIVVAALTAQYFVKFPNIARYIRVLEESTTIRRAGYYGDPNHECKCTEYQINQYLSRISGPVLDRIDLHIEINPVNYDDLDKNNLAEKSEDIKKRVNKARDIQRNRFIGEGIYSNAQMHSKHIAKFCALGERENSLLKSAFERLGLSARAYDRILKVARTIADLDDSPSITSSHIAEAIQYRNLDRKYWNR